MIYGSAVWDPILIISQITTLQCLFYLTLGIFDAIFLGPFIGQLSVVNVFGWHATIGIHSFVGWMHITANLVTACLGSVYLMWIVERAKKCLDFASTTYTIHFVSCCLSSGFPMSLAWWATNGIGLLIMALAGEWLCVQRELADIPLSAMRGRVDAMRGNDSSSAVSSSGNVASGGSRSVAATAASGSKASGSGVVEMSSGVVTRAATSATRLLASEGGRSNVSSTEA